MFGHSCIIYRPLAEHASKILHPSGNSYLVVGLVAWGFEPLVLVEGRWSPSLTSNCIYAPDPLKIPKTQRSGINHWGACLVHRLTSRHFILAVLYHGGVSLGKSLRC